MRLRFATSFRQSSGTNDHPTAAQFLLIINSLAFYNLAKPPKSGNCAPELITALVFVPKVEPENQIAILDELIDAGKFGDAGSALERCALRRSILSYHTALVTARSHDKLIYYVAGYTARKILKKTSRKECALLLTV